jgi:hypothetical protein
MTNSTGGSWNSSPATLTVPLLIFDKRKEMTYQKKRDTTYHRRQGASLVNDPQLNL